MYNCIYLYVSTPICIYINSWLANYVEVLERHGVKIRLSFRLSIPYLVQPPQNLETLCSPPTWTVLQWVITSCKVSYFSFVLLIFLSALFFYVLQIQQSIICTWCLWVFRYIFHLHFFSDIFFTLVLSQKLRKKFWKI